MQSIDLNCDMGESFGAFTIGQDELLMDYVSSVNIACGFHAGDPSVMRKTVALAVSKKVAIGAHPGYPDLQGFGRRELKLSPPETYDIVVYQIGALAAFASAAGSFLHHVKPHGALYNTAAKDPAIASAIAHAVADVNNNLLFIGLSGSVMIAEAKKAGLRTASEVFADRTYQEDGTLTPRSSDNAMIEDPAKAASQVLQMVQRKTVTTVTGKEIPVVAETVCIHGDGKYAADFARAIVSVLKQNNVSIQKP
jgi:5-oxoprolinase (ATP-hydrolysing) subunit A